MPDVNARRELPPIPRGFEHIKRFWDGKQKICVAKILPGECYVSENHEIITTVLGSCIAACVYDPVLKLAGMNHFMLPLAASYMPSRDNMASPELCYGNWAMEFLINAMLKQGALKKNLVVKIFGGAKVIDGMSSLDVGSRNIQFVESFLKNENISIAARDIGGSTPRKVILFADTGKVRLKRMKPEATASVSQSETCYMKSVSAPPKGGDVELF